VRPVVDTLPDGVVAAVRMPVADSDHPDRLVYQLVLNATINRVDPGELDSIVHQAFQSQLTTLGDFLDQARQDAVAAAGGPPASGGRAGDDDVPPGVLATPVAGDHPTATGVRDAFDALRQGRTRPPSLLHHVSGTPEHGAFHFTDGLTTPVSLVVVPAALGSDVRVYPPSTGTAPVRIVVGANARMGAGQLRAIADQVHDWWATSATKGPAVVPRPGDQPGEPVWLPKDPKRLPFGIPIAPTTVEPERDPLGDPRGRRRGRRATRNSCRSAIRSRSRTPRRPPTPIAPASRARSPRRTSAPVSDRTRRTRAGPTTTKRPTRTSARRDTAPARG
jgi:hypothetical protein